MTELTIEALQAQMQKYKADLVDPDLSDEGFLELTKKIQRIGTQVMLLEQEKRLGIVSEM